jgi:hypothetical protein
MYHQSNRDPRNNLQYGKPPPLYEEPSRRQDGPMVLRVANSNIVQTPSVHRHDGWANMEPFVVPSPQALPEAASQEEQAVFPGTSQQTPREVHFTPHRNRVLKH